MKISTHRLLLVAGIIWCIAGINIALIGLGAYFHEWGWPVIVLLVATICIFLMFHLFIFNKMVKKHAVRITGYAEERSAVWKFFDTKGYIIMAVMMGGGIGLRVSGFLPEWFIAFFYTGLGAALFVAGISFIVRYRRNEAGRCPAVSASHKDNG